MKLKIAISTLAVLFCLISIAPNAAAQATRTWVSGVGDDANPCSRTAPCKTFAGAISKTAAAGEISVLDPGGYGAVTITKSITLRGEGTLAGILNAGTNGIVINAGANDVVTVRDISIHGAGSGLSGIRFLAGKALHVDNCSISGFANNGIEAQLNASGNVTVKNTEITGGAVGIKLNTFGGRLNASVTNSSIRGSGNGITLISGFADISNSIITQNTGVGILAEAGKLSVENNIISSNGTALQSQPGAIIRASNNKIYDNGTGFACGGGAIFSSGTNYHSGSAMAGCNPNSLINIQ